MIKLKSVTLGIAALTLAACASDPVNTLVCDREAIAWDKWGEPSEMAEKCLPPSVPPHPLTTTEDEPDDPTDPVVNPIAPVVPSGPIDKVKGNNGWGNGDQTAPGNSLDNNNAENSNRSQRNHGQGNRN